MPNRPQRVTQRDVAEETGLSMATVSYALRGIQVPPETQARVREAAERLGYQADPIARALASGRTDYIGVLCRSLTDVWQQGTAAALGRRLLGAGRHALIVDASNDPVLEAELAWQLADQRVDALIVLPVDPAAAHWVEVARRTVLVSIGDGLPGASAHAEVVFDNDAGITDALHRLADFGHRRIAVMTPGGLTTPDRPAEVVAGRVARRLGLRVTLHRSPHDLDGAAAVARSVLTGADPPTAFLCMADSMAYGVYAGARALDLVVPDDVSVVGYDDHPLSRLLTPPLSTYRWPVDLLVDLVVERTVKAISSGRRSRRKVLPPQAQPRGSVSRPRPAGP
ncbi:LacI family DNA-binding transcriptional regulator [Actinacidiphila sp. DG2A-62]|uniref:LacI family DNA-binding transcriptional regulator n=1 Tax=Actinacidiphila sp. DG2A-62 TaxID=3108821 RepID=UPI002DBDF93A|nr:LacI family DNA-binding transcriptional regulator [Actinacidiphila sp. DG2A-62]MEC3997023.1 LacI family DNA-binding transcriptional regulator [Actinacidiphila sp. DG2A-62]